MEIITDINIQKGNKNRVNIYLDHEYSFSCSLELLYMKALKKGVEVNKEYLEEVISEDNYIKCKEASLKIIEHSYKTEKEVEDKLLSYGFEEKTIKKVMEFLKSYKFVDDLRYLRLFISDKKKAFGKNKLEHQLIDKGIKKELIYEELNKLSDEEEYDYAFKLLEKKMKNMVKSGISKKEIMRKAKTYLLNAGFLNEVINKVINEQIEGEAPNEEAKSEKIRALAEKKFMSLRKTDNDEYKIKNKLYRFLLGKGYEFDEVKSVVDLIMKTN